MVLPQPWVQRVTQPVAQQVDRQRQQQQRNGGEEDDPPLPREQVLLSDADQCAKAGLRRRDTDAQKGQRRLGDDGQRKADLLRELAQREGLALEQVIAVGDGANDLPMLNIAGLGIAYQAKPLVKASAKQSISNLGLDGILYLLGYSDKDIQALG